MRVSEVKKLQLQKLKEQKIKPLQKISNNFIDATIHKSNVSALKTIYYISTILHNFDYTKELDIIKIDLREMLKYTELTNKDIRNNLKAMQETSITFVNEQENIEEFISLIPRIKFHWGKNKIEIDLYSKIAKLIIKAVGQYSFINTKQLMRLKNKHSLRLLPVLYKLSQYDKDIPKRARYDLSELNELFGTSYKRIVELERKILKPTKDELDIESEISFIYEINYTNLGIGRPKAYEVVIDLVQQKHLFN